MASRIWCEATTYFSPSPILCASGWASRRQGRLCGRRLRGLHRPDRRCSADGIAYKPVDACIQFIYQIDGTHVITIEGLADRDGLHPVQQALIDQHGSQCGYCTPGIAMALAGCERGCPIEATAPRISLPATFAAARLCADLRRSRRLGQDPNSEVVGAIRFTGVAFRIGGPAQRDAEHRIGNANVLRANHAVGGGRFQVAASGSRRRGRRNRPRSAAQTRRVSSRPGC